MADDTTQRARWEFASLAGMMDRLLYGLRADIQADAHRILRTAFSEIFEVIRMIEDPDAWGTDPRLRTMVAHLREQAAGWRGYRSNAPELHPLAAPVARILGAVVEAVEAGDLDGLEGLSKPARAYLKERQHDVVDPARERAGELAYLARALGSWCAAGVTADDMARYFLATLGHLPALRASAAAETPSPEGLSVCVGPLWRHPEHDALVGKVASEFKRMVEVDLVSERAPDPKAYVRGGLKALDVGTTKWRNNLYRRQH